MKALVYRGPGERGSDTVPDPSIIDPTDAVVRIDTSTICGTDLQMLRLIASGRLDPSLFATHRFALDDTMAAYDTFADAANTNALKVVLQGAERPASQTEHASALVAHWPAQVSTRVDRDARGGSTCARVGGPAASRRGDKHVTHP